MNLLGLFLVWLLIILIFLVLYMSYFRKIKQISKTNSVVERFNSNDTIPKHCDDVANKTGSNGSNIFYTEEGPYIDKCHINMSSNNYKEYSGKNLYKLNGKNSYIFIRDYLDNNFSITLWVKFDKLSGVQTLIETKFYKVEMKGNKLHLIPKDDNDDDIKETSRSIPKFYTDNLYEIIITQNKKYSEIKLVLNKARLDRQGMLVWDIASEVTIETLMDKSQRCDYSLHNEIFIGCGRTIKQVTAPSSSSSAPSSSSSTPSSSSSAPSSSSSAPSSSSSAPSSSSSAPANTTAAGTEDEIPLKQPNNYETQNYLEGYIGIINEEFDKNEFDNYYEGKKREYIDYGMGVIDGGIKLPQTLQCNVQEEISQTTASLITTAAIALDIQSDYIEIIINNIVNDLKIKYIKSKIPDINNKNSAEAQQQSYANKFFILYQYSTEFYKHPNILKLEKKDGMFIEGYNNLFDELNNYVTYLFNLKLGDNQTYVEKFDFMDLFTVREFISKYDTLYMFILGERMSEKSHFKFLTLNKPIFMIVFKNNDDVGYEYKTIQINLVKFYTLQKKIFNYILESGNVVNDDDEYYTNTIQKYLNSKSTPFSLNPELANSKENNFMGINNFYRIYDTDLNLSISVNIYEKTKNLYDKPGVHAIPKLVDLLFVSNFNEALEKPCGFKPSGETLFNCKQLCYSEMDTNNCNNVQCDEKCDNCTNNGCKWNLLELEKQKFYVPSAIRLKGFAGSNQVKLSWIRPSSKHGVDGYYILAESPLYKKNFDLFTYNGDEEMVDYVVNNLENDMSYTFYILSKNEFGVSDLSNKVTLIPDNNKMLNMENSEIQEYSDSINQYYKDNYKDSSDDPLIIDSKKKIEQITRMMKVNELKDIIIEKLLGDGEDRYSYNLNIH